VQVLRCPDKSTSAEPRHVGRHIGTVTHHSDTLAEAQRFRTDFLRSISGSERVAMAVEMTHAVNEICRQGIAARNPGYSPEQVQRALVRVTLGSELFAVACPNETALKFEPRVP
jgi:hypothetical protein